MSKLNFSKQIIPKFFREKIIPTLKKRKKVGALAFLVILLSSGFVSKFIPDKGKSRDISAFTTIAEEGILPAIISAIGELKAEKSINVNPHRQGLIEAIYLDVGDIIEKNQVIAKISDRDFPFRLSEIKADFDNSSVVHMYDWGSGVCCSDQLSNSGFISL